MKWVLLNTPLQSIYQNFKLSIQCSYILKELVEFSDLNLVRGFLQNANTFEDWLLERDKNIFLKSLQPPQGFRKHAKSLASCQYLILQRHSSMIMWKNIGWGNPRKMWIKFSEIFKIYSEFIAPKNWSTKLLLSSNHTFDLRNEILNGTQNKAVSQSRNRQNKNWVKIWELI